MRNEMAEIVNRLRPTLGKKTDGLWALYLSAGRDERQDLETTFRLLDMKRNKTLPGSGPPALPPPQPGTLSGWLQIGQVTYPGSTPTPFGLEPGELIQYMGIFGRSGAGKTNTVMVVLKGLIQRKVPFLIFDWKRNYRDLLAAPWVPEGSVAAFTAGRDLAPLHLNPLRPPPGTEPRIWLKKMIEIMAHAYFLGEGVMYLMQEALDRCYEKAGVYEGSDNYPTFHDVHAYLKHRKVIGREANWMASTLRTTGALTFGHMADTVCAANPNNIADLLKGNVVLELDALTDTDKIFLVESLLLHIHHLRLAEPDREKLKHVPVVEEAHHVFLKAKQEIAGGEPITDVILREIRELGEAVILIDQHPSQIAITALGNTYCTIAMNLKHRFDVTTIGDACLLEPEQKDHLGRLPVGHAVVKLQDRWPTPFMVSFPIAEIRKGSVSDARLRELQPDLTKTRVDRAGTVELSEIPPQIAAKSEIPVVPEPPKDTAPELSSDQHRLLEHVFREPAAGVTQRYSALVLSRRMGTKLKLGLVEKGLLREVRVALPGGRVTLLELTQRGWLALGKEPSTNRYGGAVHRYWITKLGQALEAEGYSVDKEVPVGAGKTIDLRGVGKDKVVAVEVEASARRLKASIDKLVETEADQKILVCCDRTTLDKARALGAAVANKAAIEFRHVWSFLGKMEKRDQ